MQVKLLVFHVKHHIFTSIIRWMDTSISMSAGMTVIEADIPTGFVVMNDDLRAYVQSGRVPTLRRAEFKNRTVAFYLDYVSCSYANIIGQK